MGGCGAGLQLWTGSTPSSLQTFYNQSLYARLTRYPFTCARHCCIRTFGLYPTSDTSEVRFEGLGLKHLMRVRNMAGTEDNRQAQVAFSGLSHPAGPHIGLPAMRRFERFFQSEETRHQYLKIPRRPVSSSDSGRLIRVSTYQETTLHTPYLRHDHEARSRFRDLMLCVSIQMTYKDHQAHKNPQPRKSCPHLHATACARWDRKPDAWRLASPRVAILKATASATNHGGLTGCSDIGLAQIRQHAST